MGGALLDGCDGIGIRRDLEWNMETKVMMKHAKQNRTVNDRKERGKERYGERDRDRRRVFIGKNG